MERTKENTSVGEHSRRDPGAVNEVLRKESEKNAPNTAATGLDPEIPRLQKLHEVASRKLTITHNQKNVTSMGNATEKGNADLLVFKLSDLIYRKRKSIPRLS